jgi:hypothetical protein
LLDFFEAFFLADFLFASLLMLGTACCEMSAASSSSISKRIMLGSQRRSPVSRSVRSMLKPRQPLRRVSSRSIASRTLFDPAITRSDTPSLDARARMEIHPQ